VLEAFDLPTIERHLAALRSTDPLFDRRIDFVDFAKTVGLSVMRAGHEGPTDLC